MQRLEVSCAVRLIYMSLGAKGLIYHYAVVYQVQEQRTFSIKQYLMLYNPKKERILLDTTVVNYHTLLHIILGIVLHCTGSGVAQSV